MAGCSVLNKLNIYQQQKGINKMNKPTLFIKQCQYWTVIRLKGTIGFCMVQNKQIESVGVVAAIQQQADSAAQKNLNHAAKLYNSMAAALS